MKLCINSYNLLILLLFLSQSIFTFQSTKFLSFSEESFSKEYLNLVNYIKTNGGYISSKLSINEKSPTNRYVFTKEKIVKNEILLFIPEKVLISKLHVNVNRKCNEAYGLEEDHDYECLVYFMTIDKYNSSSIFKPYYDYLPKIDKNDFVISLTKEEQIKFNKTGIIDGIQHFYHFYNLSLEPVKERLKIFAEKNKIKYEKILEDFFYNFILVGTRNFGRPDYFADFSTLVPYLDLLNHSDRNNTFWYYDDKENGYYLLAARDIEKNEEMTDSYGKYYNSYLFKTYGFVIPGNTVHDRLYTKINTHLVRLDLDFVDDTIYHIFDKFNYDKIKLDDAKNEVLNVLYERKKYFENLTTERFALKVIFKEYIEILDVYINKVKLVTISFIKNYQK